MRQAGTISTRPDAERFANYLLRTSGLDGVRLQRGKLPAQTMAQIELSRRDYHLTKLRFFSAEGEIIFSTDTAEIGEITPRTTGAALRSSHPVSLKDLS